jgi:hypothetical protein
LVALAISAGVGPAGAATLEVRGHKSGRLISFPVVVAEYHDERYLVAMLGHLRRYLEVAPGARPFFTIDKRAPLEDFARIVDQYPVFRLA